MILFWLLIWAPSAIASDGAITVTATRLESSESETPGSISVITGDELRQKQSRNVSDVLRDVPGLSVSNQGGPGRATSVFLRGLNPEHALVLIDGVKVNDPLSPSRAFDFGNLSTENIERIEVMRGAGSVLYGSDAMGGVIQIFTKKGSGPLYATVDAEYGAYQTELVRIRAQGGDRHSDYALGAELQNTQGFSAADEALGNSEKDGRAMWTLAGRGGGEWISGLRTDLAVHSTLSRFDLDFSGGPSGDDPNYGGDLREVAARIQVKPSHVNLWEPVGSVALTVNQRTTTNDPDSVHPDYLRGTYSSSRVLADWQNNFYFSDLHTLVVGASFETEGASSTETTGFRTTTFPDKRAADFGVFVQDSMNFGRLALNDGVRVDSYNVFGLAATYRLAPNLKIGKVLDGDLTTKGVIATGFKAPSLYQLYAPTYGNSALLPERDLAWELGLEERWEKFHTSVTYFSNALENLITGNAPTFVYQNIGRAQTSGIEAEARMEFDQGSAGFSYTWLQTSDLSTGLSLLRRPSHTLSVREEYLASDRLKFGATERYVGSRADIDAVSFGRVDLPAYFLLNLDARFALSKDFRILARVENLLDAQYEEISGYGTARRSLYAGLSKDL